MKLSTTTWLIASLLQLWIARGQNSILVSPASQNLALGDTARFSCAGTGVLLSWFINQQILNGNLITSLGINHTEWTADGAQHSNITLPATASNNNSEVYCVVYQNSIVNVQSDTAVLRVQGLLSPVSNLVIQYGLQESILSWDQPFSLPGVPISYIITVTDLTTNTGSLIPSDTVSETTYQFPSSLWTRCHEYSFRVQVQNGAGDGGVNEIEDLFSGVPETPTVSITNITVTTTASITLSIEVSQCFLQQSATLAVNVVNNSTGALVKTVSQDQFSMTRFSLAVTELEPDSVYSLTVTANNMLGSATTHNIIFNTYVVQNITITNSFSNGTTCMQCVILSSGMSRGCLISIRQSDQTPCQPSQVDLQLVLPDSTTMSEFTTSFTGCTNQSQLIYSKMYSLIASNIGNQTTSSLQKSMSLEGLPCVRESPTPTAVTELSQTIRPPISTGVMVETVMFIYISAAAVAGLLAMVLVVTAIIIITFAVMRKKRKPVAYTVNRPRFNGTSVRVEEIPREEPPPAERYTPVPSPVERYSPVQEHHRTHALSNGNVRTTIRDSNPWHQREEEVHDDKPPSYRGIYHHNGRPSGYDEPDASEQQQQQQQKLQLTIVEEALKFRKENMERLQYKRPLSVLPTTTTTNTGADDEDSDQMDYDHLSDEESDSVFEERSVPHSRSHQFYTQQQQQLQQEQQRQYQYHQRPQRAHSHHQHSSGQHYTINHHIPHTVTHSLSRAPHHSSLPQTWQD